jgi:hypothetical protein
LQQVGGFLRVLRYQKNKTDHHDITEILLKMVLNTTILTLILLQLIYLKITVNHEIKNRKYHTVGTDPKI